MSVDVGVGAAAPLRVVGVSGSLHAPSKTTVLVEAIVSALAARVPVASTIIDIADLGGSFAGALTRAELGAPARQALHDIETADLLVVASPVYRASFTGLFKHLFDFVEQYALVGTPVIVAATGGGDRHALILEHQLRPLFGFFQALTLPVGVYASAADFDGYALTSPAVRARIDQAVDGGLPLIRKAVAQEVSRYVSTW
ncbi:FMN reductase [Microbacterium sp. zg.Y1090]|uniref:FMN reductase n=1 Tax=Microbacterium TaxID=33882 RepID=UPI00214BE8DE|nr:MULTISPECIES: FMN reductase [unclassified Microbacterium]MCR2812413.1 FMN reductase [Microbacterium sp. zg.Y1084]MCR2817786.1 FMN reductase [Microbacterium sp. zg.Y1090]MDL5485570.1 FMN reductase [Microbacterium sp. zg-Y1211]WIM28741.1 FMN reductase [Microbacterium sp. zg-Y1090]